MNAYQLTDGAFKRYGQLLHMEAEALIRAAEQIGMPEQGSVYLPSVEAFEKLPVHRFFERVCFGEMPVQTGYCYGHSSFLNAVEWHKSSEINVAVTDFVLFLGRVEDLDADGRYNSAHMQAFRVQKGQVLELYAGTLHFCPCEVHASGFGCVVALPKGTNTDLEYQPEDQRLFRRNKWILCHEENDALIRRGVVPAVYGENYKVACAD